MLSLKKAVTGFVVAFGVLLSLASGSVQAQINYSAALDGSSPTFARPEPGAPPTSAQAAATYKYHRYSFTVATSGLYSFVSTASYDNFTVLYSGSFTPSAPLTNALIANDDLGDLSHSGFDYYLDAGTSYFFVTTSYGAGITGTFTNTITASSVPNPVFQRPDSGYPPSTLGDYAHYEVETWTPTTTGFYKVKTIAADPSTFDTVTVLYDTTFDPRNPLSNVIVSNDEFVNEGGGSGFYFSAAAGHTYKIVTTGYASSDYGAFTTEKTLIAPTQLSLTDTTVGAPLFTDGGNPAKGRPNANDNLPPTSRSANTPPYKAYSFFVGTSGNYSFHVIHPDPITTQFDTYLILFTGGVNLADTSNALIANDDFDTRTNFNRSGFLDVPLTTGTAYTIVVTGYATNTVPSSSGDFRLEVFGPGTVKVVRLVKISGTITTAVPNKTLPITFTVRPVGGTSADDITRTIAVTTDAQGVGTYQLSDLPAGTVNLVAKGQLTLQTLVSNINANSDVTGINFTLRSGDANGDGFADISDLLLLINSYNKTKAANPDSYSAAVDFNYDDSDDISDLLILIGSYNQSSQYLP